MKLFKIFISVLSILIVFIPAAYCEDEEIILETKNLIQEESVLEEEYVPVLEGEASTTEQKEIPDISKVQEITTPNSKIFDKITQSAKDVYKLEIENTRVPSCLLKEQLTHHFEKGPLESIHFWNGIKMNLSTDIAENNDTHTTYRIPVINTFFDGKFKGGKENFRIMLDTTPQHDRSFMSNLFQDLYIDTRRIKNNRILIGNSRPGVGYEGAGSSYTLPFANRSQIARNFGTVRKTGIRVMGNYPMIDYDLGGYSSQTYFREFFPGAEFDGWVTLKPLAQTKKKYGDIKIGYGIATGKRHSTDFFVQSTYLGYEYKKFRLKAEYANANGSNGASGLTDKKRQGWSVTAYYLINKKLEAVARYDEFDPDKKVSHNNKREYSVGLNYYIKGQALKLILNYVFCQNQGTKDSHRILIGAQIAL